VADEKLDAASDRITSAIGEAIKAGELGDDTNGMPAAFVLCATYFDSEGKVCTAFLTNNGARTHETLGLLALGDVAWRENARRWVHDSEDE
jgi:hypothetical protein